MARRGSVAAGPRPSAARSAVRALGAMLGEKHAGTCRLIKPGDLRKPRFISSGVDAVDVALGTGGWPEGRLAILHGPEACGKTTLALHTAAEFQRQGGAVVYVDWERKLDIAYAEALGVDFEALAYVTPPFIERGFDMLSKAAKLLREQDADQPILFVWDSFQAAPAKRTYEGNYEDENFNPECRAYSGGLMRLIPELSDTRAFMLGISQVRMKLGGKQAREKIAVGQAPNFYASIICQWRTGVGKGNTETGRNGEESEVIVRKNQVAPPWRTARFPIVYGTGADLGGSLLNAAITVGLATAGAKKGGWYLLETPGGTIKVQGASGVNRFREQKPEEYAAFRAAVRSKIGTLPEPAKPNDETEEDEDDGSPPEEDET